MIFEPKTEKELADSRLLPKGAYDFEIEDAWEKKSAAGNDMIELKVRVFERQWHVPHARGLPGGETP